MASVEYKSLFSLQPATAGGRHPLAFENQNIDPYQPRQPVRRPPSRAARVFWVFIVLIVMGGVLGGLWYFNQFRNGMIAKYLAANVPPPVPVAVVEGKTRTVERDPSKPSVRWRLCAK